MSRPGFRVGIALLSSYLPVASATAEPASIGQLAVQAVVPISGHAIAFDFDALWVLSDEHLVRVDATDGSLIEIALPGGDEVSFAAGSDRYRGIAVGEGAVWLPDVAASVIHKVDPQSNQVVMTIPTDIFGGRGSIGVGGGSVWVVTFDDHDKTLVRYDAVTGTEQARTALPRPCVGVLFAHGSVWITAANAGELYRIDPGTNEIIATVPLHGGSHLLAASEDSIWIAFDDEGIVQRFDGGTGELTATIATGVTDMESDGDITVGGGFIWTITRGSMIAQVDPATDAVVGVMQPDPGTLMGRRIRYGAESLWVSGASIFRIAPPRVADGAE
jgi:virginiamycin B lyase